MLKSPQNYITQKQTGANKMKTLLTAKDCLLFLSGYGYGNGDGYGDGDGYGNGNRCYFEKQNNI